MDRKGQYLTARKFLSVFKTIFILVIGIFLVLFTLNTASVDKDRIRDLQMTLYAEQLLNNHLCFAYEQPSGRIDHRVLDVTKLDQEHLEKCSTLSTEPPYKLVPVKVTIIDPEASRPSSLHTTPWTGERSSTTTFKQEVALREDEEERQATIIIHVNPW
ncbi:MAG: hypothetical protein ACLFO2_00530 [Candidatus Woesearchaeota archaeon]